VALSKECRAEIEYEPIPASTAIPHFFLECRNRLPNRAPIPSGLLDGSVAAIPMDVDPVRRICSLSDTGAVAADRRSLRLLQRRTSGDLALEMYQSSDLRGVPVVGVIA
jgi:hypothetical protein